MGTICYLGCLPLGWVSYKEYQRKDAMSAAQASVAPEAALPNAPPLHSAEDPERPARLN
jgi:hypothetical protein